MHGKGFYQYADDFRDDNRVRANDHMHRYTGEFYEGKFDGKGKFLYHILWAANNNLNRSLSLARSLFCDLSGTRDRMLIGTQSRLGNNFCQA